MSVSTTAHPEPRARVNAKLWIGFLALIAAGVGLAWAGASPLRPETTDSGLVFRTIEEGSGPQVKASDGVVIEYEARLEDGTVFDSTEGRGPAPMIAGQVIPGFAEALTRMQAGGSYRVKIPSRLGYGETPPPGSPIPPNADLEFDVKVLQVVPDAGLMQQGMPPQGMPQQP